MAGEIVALDLGIWPGHSASYTKRLISLFRQAGLVVTLVASADYDTEADVHVTTDRGFDYSRFLADLEPSTSVIDLDYAQTLKSGRFWHRGGRPVTHVLHGLASFRPTAKREHLRPRTWLRVSYFMSSCWRDAAAGHRVVVHTLTAQRYLAGLGIPTTYHPLPVLLNEHVEQHGQQQPSLPATFYLFVGGTSRPKGFELGIQALLRSKCPVLPIVVTGCAANYRETVGEFSIQYMHRVEESTLWSLYQNATLLILPYSKEYERSGAASLVLQEALHAGCRVVAGPWAVEQTSASSVSIASSYSASDFAVAIQYALNGRPSPEPSTIDASQYASLLLSAWT